MDLLSPAAIVVTGAITLLAVVFATLRHASRRAIALHAVGYPLFLVGSGWAMGLGPDAFYAAAVATIGGMMIGMATQRSRRESARV